MTSTTPVVEPLAPLVLSSEALGPRDRFARWREELMLRVIRVDVDVPDRENFRTDLHVMKLPGIDVIERRSTPSLVRRDRALVRDGTDDLVVSFLWEGASLWWGAAGEAEVAPGQAIVSALDEIGGYRAPAGSAGAAIRIARRRAARSVRGIEASLGRALAIPSGATTLLKAYLGVLMSAQPLPVSTALIAAHQVEELLAHVFDPDGDLARAESHGGVRAARLRAALSEVAANLSSPDLGAASIARRLGVSERYVHRLMEEAGLSLSTHIREERLRLARRLIEDPRREERRISAIAEEAGFGDLSYFNRIFRRQFGMTPREARVERQNREFD